MTPQIDYKSLEAQDSYIYNEIFRDNVYGVDKKDIEGKYVLDIGGNRGFFSILALNYGAKDIVVVEPVTSIYKQLCDNVKEYYNITRFNYAVTDKDKDTVTLLSKGGESKVINECSTWNVNEYSNAKTITLKTLLREFNNDINNIVLKMDCEGSEYDILMNIDEQTIRRFETIFIEIHGEMNPKYQDKDLSMLKKKIESFGFVEIQGRMMFNKDGIMPVGVFKFERRNDVLAYICTKGRYDTTLPMAMMAIATQTVLPSKFVLFDDNDNPKDLRDIQHYKYIFQVLEEKKIKWEVIYGKKMGQHHSHEMANNMGFKWAWRVDDDCIPEPDTLAKLLAVTDDTIGAVGGAILTPPIHQGQGSGKIEDIYSKPNLQWFKINDTQDVDHLHCSFLYRTGIAHYNLALSKVAHREETLFTYDLKKAGYRILITPSTTWHLKNPYGGIRSGTQKMFEHDEMIFASLVNAGKIIVLDCGLGDHILFKKILPEIRKKYEKLVLAVCYPEVFEDTDVNLISIAMAKDLLGNIDNHSVYKWMIDHNWNKPVAEAFLQMCA